MKFSLITLTIIMITSTYAQPISSELFQPPAPVGGLEALQNRISCNSKIIPQNAEIQVIVSFRVTAGGVAERFRIKQSGGCYVDQEVIQAIQRHDWNPASYQGSPRDIRYSMTFLIVNPTPQSIAQLAYGII